MSDATVLLRDIAGDAASNAANVVKPDEEKLAQIDQPAEANTWHDAPDLSSSTIKNKIQSAIPVGKKDVDKVVGDASAAAHPEGSRDPAATADVAATDAQQGTQSVDVGAAAQVTNKAIKDKLNETVPEDQKQKAREYREKTKNYFKNKVPKGRREQTAYRLKKMLVEIQGHSDCKLCSA